MLSRLRSGAIEFFTLSGPILSMLVPVASINGIGFAFTDYAAVSKAMDGDLGAYVRAQIEKADLVAMEKIRTTASARSPRAASLSRLPTTFGTSKSAFR